MHQEILEPRRLLSVTVSEGYPGFYEIQGDNSANDISVSVSMNDDTFTLNGTTYPDVAYIFVEGYGGDDNIHVLSVDGSGMIGASIVAAEGNDDIALNFDGAVWAGSGNDTLHLSDSFRGEAYGESGNDRIFISGACLDPEIQGGDGNDLIDASENFTGVVIRGGNGNDTIYGSAYDDQIYGDDGNDALFGNSGNDAFYASDGTRDQINGGDGHDIVYGDAGGGNVTEVEEIYS